jgi:hypothetical protein
VFNNLVVPIKIKTMFHHHDDPGFKKIIDDFILSSIDGDKSFSNAIKNIDLAAAKKGVSFYQMMFLLIQKTALENKKRNG